MEVELLAPAGNFDSLKLAVAHGANAVYFGAKNFNARAKAENFGSDLNDAVALCHMYGLKAYLTLNTLVENDQIDDLVQTIKHALECKVDAFIVQDFGVVNILKNCFKGAVFHTSTQMAVNNYLGAIHAQKMGAERVVVSREANLKDISLIKQKTNVEIECFVQGALCVSFSGNCYLSGMMFNKSGNKGECMQPCRLPYTAFLDNNKIASGYLLSAKDICMAPILSELKNAGVSSFKIEGRLRRPAYVAGAVKTYRQILDNNFKVTDQDITNLKKCFNRGDYTLGYTQGNGNIIAPDHQGHLGVKIGKIDDIVFGKKFNTVKIKSNTQINKGDVLKFVDGGKEIGLITAYDIKYKNNLYEITTTTKLKKGGCFIFNFGCKI